MIHVLIRGRNCEKYIGKCIRSLSLQSPPWCAYILLDRPTDKSWELAKDAARSVNNTNSVLVKNQEQRMGLGYNMFHGIKRIGELYKPSPGDLVAIIDADDTIEPRAFNIVEREYIKYPNTLVTHGSYIKKSRNRKTKISQPYPNRVNFRKHPWRGSHLKTFKWKLWEHMNSDCFVHNGVWAEAASDLALMLPLMELAGRDRVRHIKDPIYIWRDSYHGSTPSGLQKKWDAIIRSKAPMRRLNDNNLKKSEDTIG